MSLLALLPFISVDEARTDVRQPSTDPAAVDLYLESLHQAEINREPPPPSPSSFGDNVDKWRPTVQEFFRAEDVDWAMRIIACESEGNPNAVNPHSGATGLFQHLPEYWDHRAAMAGYGGAHATEPRANIAASAWLYYVPESWGGPGNWVCK